MYPWQYIDQYIIECICSSTCIHNYIIIAMQRSTLSLCVVWKYFICMSVQWKRIRILGALRTIENNGSQFIAQIVQNGSVLVRPWFRFTKEVDLMSLMSWFETSVSFNNFWNEQDYAFTDRLHTLQSASSIMLQFVKSLFRKRGV